MRPAEAVMDLGRDVARLLGFLLQGSSTNWWGLGCPAHCSGSLLRLCLWSLDLASARASFLDFSFSGRSSSCPVLELPLFRSPRHHFPRPRGHLHFGSEATCMSRGNLLRTIRSAVDSLRGVLAELEEDSEEWPPASEQLSLPGLGPSRSTDIPVSPPVAACPSTTSALPRPGDPLPSDGLFLVASLHVAERPARALRAWESGLQAGCVLRGEQGYPNFGGAQPRVSCSSLLGRPHPSLLHFLRPLQAAHWSLGTR